MDFWKKLLSVQILHDNSGDIEYKEKGGKAPFLLASTQLDEVAKGFLLAWASGSKASKGSILMAKLIEAVH